MGRTSTNAQMPPKMVRITMTKGSPRQARMMQFRMDEHRSTPTCFWLCIRWRHVKTSWSDSGSNAGKISNIIIEMFFVWLVRENWTGNISSAYGILRFSTIEILDSNFMYNVLIVGWRWSIKKTNNSKQIEFLTSLFLPLVRTSVDLHIYRVLCTNFSLRLSNRIFPWCSTEH